MPKRRGERREPASRLATSSLNSRSSFLLTMRTTFALLCCPCSYGLLRRNRGVVETIPTLEQVFQLPGEACCRSAIDHIVIKTDRQTETAPESYVPINDTRLLANTALRIHECWGAGGMSQPAPGLL